MPYSSGSLKEGARIWSMKIRESAFCEKLIEEKGIVVTPGSGFGDEGEGYFRISTTIGEERIQEAIKRLKSLKL
jgi:aspartate/methionine/tyrosine aminotransferase